MTAAVTVAAMAAGCRTAPEPVADAVVVEFRPASDEPGEGRMPMADPFSDATLYVSDAVLISNADIVSAQVHESTEVGPRVGVQLTDAAAARFGDATEAMVGEMIAVVVNGEVVTAPIVQTRIEKHVAITGDFTMEEAERIAAGLNGGGH